MKKRILIVFSIYLALTTLMTYPLSFKMDTHILGIFNTQEPFFIIWEAWKQSFTHVSPEYQGFVFRLFDVPGANLFNFFIGIAILKWLTIFTNPVFTYNLHIWFSFLFSAFFTYLLVKYLTRNNYAAVFAGIIYAFCPYHFARSWQHFGLAQIQWMPLCLLALCILKEEKSLKPVMFVIFSFFIVSLDYTYTYFMLVIYTLFVVLFLFNKAEKEKIKFIKLISLSALLTFLVTLPFNYTLYKSFIFGPPKEAAGLFYRSFKDLFVQSARPLSYFLPAAVHPIFGKFTERFVGFSLYGVSFVEHTLYLGWIPISLAVFSYSRWKKGRKAEAGNKNKLLSERETFYITFFIGLVIVAWFFSQPPWWNIGHLKILMPSFFMYKILPMFRAYCRFGIVVMLAVTVLAGYGLKFILEKVKSGKLKVFITVLGCLLVLFEFLNWPPLKIIDVSKVPEVYYWLKEQPDTFVVAEYPLDIEGAKETYTYNQIFHQKTIINGPIPGSYLHEVAQSIKDLSELKATNILKWMGVKYVLVHERYYKESELIQQIKELENIPKNKGLRFIKSFSPQDCPPHEMCTYKSGKIDVYEVVAEPISFNKGGNKNNE